MAGPPWTPHNCGPHRLCPMFPKAPLHVPQLTGSAPCVLHRRPPSLQDTNPESFLVHSTQLPKCFLNPSHPLPRSHCPFSGLGLKVTEAWTSPCLQFPSHPNPTSHPSNFSEMQIRTYPSPTQYPAWLSMACPGLSANSVAGDTSCPFRINLWGFEDHLSSVQAPIGLADKIQAVQLNVNFC